MSEKSETTLKFSAPGSLLTPPGTCESAVERWNPSVGLRLGGTPGTEVDGSMGYFFTIMNG